MIWLWIAAAVASAGVAALTVQRAARAAARAGLDNPAMAVYRRQMSELDDLAERGLLADSERRTVRAETGRRLLAAAARSEAPLRPANPRTILLAAAALPLAALAAYLAVGAPNFPDQPFALRLKGWEEAAVAGSQLDAPEAAAVWRDIAAQHPQDPTPLRELARYELAAGQPYEAEQALERAISIAPGHGDLWEMLGLVSVAKANGDVDADAVADFRRAVALDATLVEAPYYLARARIASGDARGGLADWRSLDARLAPDDPRRAELDADIQRVSTTGRLEAPAAEGVGPPQIQAMVDGLAARLKANPDDPDGWVRLVRAYAVLHEAARLQAALGQARARYAARPEVLKALETAASPVPGAALSPLKP
jgi:cytochrome c-type biogenesis protein CcmH